MLSRVRDDKRLIKTPMVRKGCRHKRNPGKRPSSGVGEASGKNVTGYRVIAAIDKTEFVARKVLLSRESSEIDQDLSHKSMVSAQRTRTIVKVSQHSNRRRSQKMAWLNCEMCPH
jgi:hypothetical protein